MEFFIALQAFIASVLFKKDDYNFTKKTFNPVKVIVNMLVIGNIWFTGYLIVTLNHVQEVVESNCPAVMKTEPDIFLRLPEESKHTKAQEKP